MSKENPSAKALSSLRAKHLQALENITTLTDQLAETTNKSNNTDAIQIALKKEQTKFAAEKLQLELTTATLREQLTKAENDNVELTSTNENITAECTQWKEQCRLLAERIETQKSAFVEASDQVSQLRAEISKIQTTHQNELEELSNASTQDLVSLKEWREKCERLEFEKNQSSSTSHGLSSQVDKLKNEIKRLTSMRKNDQAILAEQANKLQNISQKKMNEMEERLESMRTELVTSQQMNARFKKSSTDDSNNLRTAMKKILMLENEVTEKNRHSEFLSKSLEQAKTEWNQLTQENALLKQRLAQLEQLANGGSKFAKFVAIKEENFKLADQNARLQKAHRNIRKKNQKNSKFRPPGLPRRPETNNF